MPDPFKENTMALDIGSEPDQPKPSKRPKLKEPSDGNGWQNTIAATADKPATWVRNDVIVCSDVIEGDGEYAWYLSILRVVRGTPEQRAEAKAKQGSLTVRAPRDEDVRQVLRHFRMTGAKIHTGVPGSLAVHAVKDCP